MVSFISLQLVNTKYTLDVTILLLLIEGTGNDDHANGSVDD